MNIFKRNLFMFLFFIKKRDILALNSTNCVLHLHSLDDKSELGLGLGLPNSFISLDLRFPFLPKVSGISIFSHSRLILPKSSLWSTTDCKAIT